MADKRKLTAGEIVAARAIFGSDIDYSRVYIHRGKWMPFQPHDTAMTPLGEIYFPQGVYKADFSTNVPDKAWLIHELTHVWQYQQGANLILAAPGSRNYDYGKITRATRFDRLNIEQQASVVADYYLIQQGHSPEHGSGTLSDYRAVIPFVAH